MLQHFRIGNDHIGTAAMHFHRAVQLRAAGACDFIQNNPGWASGSEIGIALDQTAKLGLRHVGIGIVENRARCADVELLVLIVRQARRIRRGDIDQRHTVCGCAHSWPVGSSRIGIGLDLRGLCQKRLGSEHKAQHINQYGLDKAGGKAQYTI